MKDPITCADDHKDSHLDRWHYLDYRDQQHGKHYFEWKYFNFIQDDLAGYVVYYVADPESKTKFGGGRLLVRVFKKDEVVGSIRKISTDHVQFDPASANASMDSAVILEKAPCHYELAGSFEDVSWKLDYHQQAPTIASFSDVNPGLLRWEKTGWLIKMPKAKVVGEIRVGNEQFKINGTGYSDTNWGMTMPLFSRYEWGQFNDEHTSFVFGILYGIKKVTGAYCYLTVDGNRIVIENSISRSEHTSWTRDRHTNLQIPAESVTVISDKEYMIRFSTKLLFNDTVGMKISSFLPKSAVSEQIVEYHGVVEKNGKKIHEFRGRGFREWSTRTWKNIPLLF